MLSNLPYIYSIIFIQLKFQIICSLNPIIQLIDLIPTTKLLLQKKDKPVLESLVLLFSLLNSDYSLLMDLAVTSLMNLVHGEVQLIFQLWSMMSSAKVVRVCSFTLQPWFSPWLPSDVCMPQFQEQLLQDSSYHFSLLATLQFSHQLFKNSGIISLSVHSTTAHGIMEIGQGWEITIIISPQITSLFHSMIWEFHS